MPPCVHKSPFAILSLQHALLHLCALINQILLDILSLKKTRFMFYQLSVSFFECGLLLC